MKQLLLTASANHSILTRMNLGFHGKSALLIAFMACLVACTFVKPAAETSAPWMVLAAQHPAVGTQFPDELADHAGAIDAVAPMWFNVADDGAITPLANCTGPYTAYLGRARQYAVKVMPILRNFAPQPMLADAGAIARCAAEAAALVERESFAGLVIDFEQLKAPSRQGLIDFVAALYPLMRQQHRTLGVAVAAKAWQHEYDYRALADHCDFLYLMTYDYVGSWSKRIGPTSPLRWAQHSHDIERDLQDLLALGVPAHKIIMGVPLYAVDFALESDTEYETVTAIYLNKVRALREQYRAEPRYDSEMQAASFAYTDDAGRSHVVWYDNADAFAAKIALARRLKLGGIAPWALRYPQQSVGADLWPQLPAR